MKMTSLSPVIYVDEIEPCLTFWTERLGFTIAAQVPEGQRLGFAMLVSGDVTVMYQTYESAEKDVPGLVARPAGTNYLFVKIEDFEAVRGALEGVETIIEDRTTFYGARETFVRAPCGSVVGFAQFS